MSTNNQPPQAGQSSRTGQSYRTGVVFALAAGVFLSTAGILIRQIEQADVWQVLFYRSLAFLATVLVFIKLTSKQGIVHEFRTFRWSDLIVSFSLGTGFIFYVLSIYKTSVAITVLLLSTGPFLVAFLGQFILKEQVSRTTWIAIAIAMSGVAIMVSSGIDSDDWYGIAYALLAVSAFAIMVIQLRRSNAEREMLPATSLAGLVAALLCLPFMTGLHISAHDLLISVLLGSVQIGGGFILITLATKSVPAAQVPLLALGETALAPLWVWWLINEIPTDNTLFGGVLILLAVLIQGLMASRTTMNS